MTTGEAADVSVAAGLLRLSFLVQGVFARASERHDLTPAQARLLCILAGGPRGMDLAGRLSLMLFEHRFARLSSQLHLRSKLQDGSDKTGMPSWGRAAGAMARGARAARARSTKSWTEGNCIRRSGVRAFRRSGSTKTA